ncbi:methyltransferase domain-containing protein [Paenibacillus filicis]|uniref:Methyltransferase domain-containing protein n=1 Tax=Paenibacillus gyeongsangnamensis TaxID=3388067 RepID=A0ABT4QG57_9BACL|nr:SAM-dependent methyltransferase [Paenibacillus filicis]MCZ8515865.1 methyltransferase domain-containing protein [Paenibacillus filicis]
MDQGAVMGISVWIGTSNRGFAQQAQEEIRRLFEAPVRFEWLAAGELFKFTVEESRERVVERILAGAPAFLRHMQPVEAEADLGEDLQATVAWLQRQLKERPPGAGQRIAVQVRKTEEGASGLSVPELKHAVDELLEQEWQAVPVAREADEVLSLLAAGGRLYFGRSAPHENISDWPGGAIRFRREEGQISRAKFKLLEAEQAFGLDFAQYRSALDIGAAPGGWTSLLLERGLQVTAVDPAKLDATLLRSPRLRYLQKNADDVAFAAGEFDLLVCDMSWSHRQMAKLVKGLLYALQPGGTAVITVKLMHKKAFQTIREVTQDLAPELSLQQAKQLFHNREELTLFFLKL